MLVRVDESQAMLADDLFRCVAEQALDRRAGVHGYALAIEHDRSIRAVLDQYAKALLARLQRFFRPPAPDELADLAADGGQCGELFLIRLPNCAIEEFHHAEYFPVEQDRKGDGAVQS